jgi:hypothetical protein
MCAPELPGGNRPMNHRIAVPEAARKHGGILVLRGHDRAEPVKREEVLGPGQRHQRPARGVGRIRNDPLAAILDPGQPRVFHAPRFFGKMDRVRSEARLRVDVPVRHAIVAPSHGQMGMPSAILHADEQHRVIADLTRAGVEHRMGRVGPVPGGEDRVGGVTAEQFRV